MFIIGRWVGVEERVSGSLCLPCGYLKTGLRMLQGVADVLLPLDLPELVPGFGQLAAEAFVFFAAAAGLFGLLFEPGDTLLQLGFVALLHLVGIGGLAGVVGLNFVLQRLPGFGLVFGRDGELVAEAGAGAAAFGAEHGLAVGFGAAHGGAAVEADVVGVGGHGFR